MLKTSIKDGYSTIVKSKWVFLMHATYLKCLWSLNEHIFSLFWLYSLHLHWFSKSFSWPFKKEKKSQIIIYFWKCCLFVLGLWWMGDHQQYLVTGTPSNVPSRLARTCFCSTHHCLCCSEYTIWTIHHVHCAVKFMPLHYGKRTSSCISCLYHVYMLKNACLDRNSLSIR